MNVDDNTMNDNNSMNDNNTMNNDIETILNTIFSHNVLMSNTLMSNNIASNTNVSNSLVYDTLENENKELNNTIERNRKIIRKIKKIKENLKKREGGCTENDKKEEEKFIIPTKETFLKDNKYSISQLKEICKNYKQKISGTKKELVERISNYFKKSDCIYVIQRLCRRFIYKKYKKLHGPARMNRELCVNETDFYTMEPIKDIPYNQFFSFRDKDGTIYGFDILSLYTLLFTQNDNHDVTNPYNRKQLPVTMMRDLKKLISLSKLLKLEVMISHEEEVKEYICPKKELELLSNSLFQYIDQLGNYTDPNWFWSLGNRQLIRFLHELNDIWSYRSQLTHQMKRDICPPIGNPFINVHLNLVSVHMSLFELKRIALNVIEQMIKRGISASNRSLGANYVLCALTLVSADAAAAIPWLYQSVV
jgi:hypothetical protein